MERIKWIDQTRGLAIFLVILGHIIGGLDFGVGGGTGNVLWKIIYSFHMPLIFSISGAVSNEERICNITGKRECFYYLAKCVINLYGTYLIFGYLFWAVKFFLYQGNKAVTLADALRLPFDSSGWGAGWYLLALLMIKIIDFWIIKGIRNHNVRIAIWIFLFLFGRYFPIAFVANACSNGLYFQFGRRWKKGSFENPESLMGILMIAGVLRYEGVLEYFMDFFIAVVLCEIVIMFMIQAKDKKMKLFEEIGKYSMIPYVLHAYFTIPVRVVLNKLNCDSFSVFVFMEFLFAVVLSYFVIHFVKKFPCIKRIFYPV